MKKIKMVAAILAIVISSYMTLFLLTVVFNEFDALTAAPMLDYWTTCYYSISSAAYIMAVLGLLVCIAAIVLGSIFCLKTSGKGTAIALMSVVVASNIFTIGFSIEANSLYNNAKGVVLVHTAIMTGIVILVSLYLVMAHKAKTEAKQEEANKTAPAPTLEEKIASLKQLKAEKAITPAEYKKRVFEIIDAK